MDFIHDLGDFKSRDAARAWATKMDDRNWLPRVGCARSDEGGRRPDVFCGWTPKSDNLRHELIGTRFCLLRWEGATFKRGYEVDELTRPDVEMWMGSLYPVEIECATMPRNRVRARWHKYAKFEGRVLVVTVSNVPRGIDAVERMQQLMQWSAELPRALFTTIEQLEEHGPHARVWLDLSGQYRRIKTLQERATAKAAEEAA